MKNSYTKNKLFSTLPKEEKVKLIEKNIFFLKSEFIDLKQEVRKLSIFLNNETNKYGLPKIHIKLVNHKKIKEQYEVEFFFGNQTKNIDETIEQLLLMETDVEKKQMLNENKDRFNILSNVMPDKFDFSIYERDTNYEVYFDRYRLTLAGWIKGPVSKERIQFIKGKSMDKQILRLIKRLEFTTMYSENLENMDANEIVSLFMIEKIQGTKEFEKYVIEKIELVVNEIKSKVCKLLSANIIIEDLEAKKKDIILDQHDKFIKIISKEEAS